MNTGQMGLFLCRLTRLLYTAHTYIIVEVVETITLTTVNEDALHMFPVCGIQEHVKGGRWSEEETL